MQTRIVDLAGTEVSYRVRHSRRRTIGLRIDADGLVITLPQRTPAVEADRVARDRAGWILPRLEKMERPGATGVYRRAGRNHWLSRPGTGRTD